MYVIIKGRICLGKQMSKKAIVWYANGQDGDVDYAITCPPCQDVSLFPGKPRVI